MSRRTVTALVLLLAVTGCSSAPEMGVRYRAERDFWQANREFQRRAIRPELVEDAQWLAVADRFEQVGDRYWDTSVPEGSEKAVLAAQNTRMIAAQAWTRAAELRLSQSDTLHAGELYDRVETRFADLPRVAAAGMLAKGRIAQLQGRNDDARVEYGKVVASVQPVTGHPGLPGEVMRLPLTMARIHAAETEPGPARVAAYDGATAYYRARIKEFPGTRNEADARSRLIDIATDLKDWQQTVVELQGLEALMTEMSDPPQDPAEVRYGIADAQRLGLRDPDLGAATLERLIEDYPESSQAGRACLSLGKHYGGPGGNPERALEVLAIIDRDYSNDLELAANARLHRGKIQEQEGRWADALETFRTLPIEFPLSEASLASHLEIVGHYDRGGDGRARAEALGDAERAYRAAIERFPSESFTASARIKLAFDLTEQKRYEEAIEEYLGLADTAGGTPAGAQALVLAARVADGMMNDAERAAGVYDRIVADYPGTELAERAATRALELRGGP